MSYVLNTSEGFADESAAGFVSVHRSLVRRVPGGVARRTRTPAGNVAVVIGGGSGHYPAFAGLVGEGLAHAAAMGNVFASPSTQQICSVARSVATDAGVLLSYGNYAGDVLNFDLAQQRLIDEGIPCRTVRVTDDVCSAPSSEAHKRRGIAGDLAVFRAAGWASAQGFDLDTVAGIAARANARTRSLGVAFSGCTLPGADAPLFTVPEGQMAVGMGIHGEPGLEVRPLGTADEIARLLVEGLLADAPDDHGTRVAVIVNGLGSVKAEELFVVYGAVERLLDEAGLIVIEPEVGEYATSFEMAGVSLTLSWLDEELEAAWRSPAYTPAYRKGAVETSGTEAVLENDAAIEQSIAAGTAESAEAGVRVVAAIAAIKAVIDREADELGRLDAVAGDGDHGIGMQRGVRAADEAARAASESSAGAGAVLIAAGDAWADKAGGTSGALWGAALRALGATIGDVSAPAATTVAAGIEAARKAVQDYGGAEEGDKTLVDALVPFAHELAEQTAEGADLLTAWRRAAGAATDAAHRTADLIPRVGRARPHTEKSLGTPDPGAISLALAVTAVADTLGDH